MKLDIRILKHKLQITHENCDDTYYIEQDGCRFWITSNMGLNGYEGDGHISFEAALAQVKRLIKSEILDKKQAG